MFQHTKLGSLFLAAYFLSIILASILVVYVGVVPVGLGLYAPAGAYIIGITLVLRDIAQDYLGPKATYVAMISGTALSAVLSPNLALGSAVAFIVGETLDMFIYTPLRKRGYLVTPILASNTVGLLADSAIFLTLAFGDLTFFTGQAWAKLTATLFASACIWLVYRNREDKRPHYLAHRYK